MLLLYPAFGGCTTTILHGLTYPKIICTPEEEEREKMATLRSVDRHFRRPVHQKSWRKGKTSGDAMRKCSTGWRLTRLTRSLKDSPSKTTKAESFRGCRPWTETQQVNPQQSASPPCSRVKGSLFRQDGAHRSVVSVRVLVVFSSPAPS